MLLASWQVYLIASPYILLGLAAAGLLHILIPSDRIARWLGGQGFGATTRAAFLGIPLPLCSCAVVPVTIELSRKGASREASLAFLVSTPETGVDSILLTYGLMGPVMAIARPLAALATSLVAATASMFWRGKEESVVSQETSGCSTCSDSEPASATKSAARAPGSFATAIRYGFGEMVDEIGFWLVVGILLTGTITALIPDHWLEGTLGEGPLALFILLLLGIPLYMCASASTPVGAALLLKGISPGAVLVFLLAGPATNASSLVVLARFFGSRFVAIYLFSVVATALLTGWLFDLALIRFGLEIVPQWSEGHLESISWITMASTVVLSVLLILSMVRGSWRAAITELVRDARSWKSLFRS